MTKNYISDPRLKIKLHTVTSTSPATEAQLFL